MIPYFIFHDFVKRELKGVLKSRSKKMGYRPHSPLHTPYQRLPHPDSITDRDRHLENSPL
jgi:hypothetical protein